jgi:EmrB/QacA subfamily drug resistance transporter
MVEVATVLGVSSEREPNRWAVLALLGIAQLMVVLDVTIVNIALPSAQRALHFSTVNRQWIITAYALAFGSLLLLGGKLGDLFGRKWTFIAGLLGFAGASALGGLAQSFGVLVAARALQGAFGALLAPSALSLLTVTFAGSPDRPKAFGIFGAIAGAGGSIGLLLGGILTQALSWRWCLYVNLFIAIPAALVSWRVLVNQAHPQRPRIDFPGVITATGGLFAIVYGFSNAATHSWGDSLTVIAFVVGVVLLVAFVAIERTTNDPLLPLHVVWDRARGGMYASILLAVSGIFGVFVFITFFMQENLHFSPIGNGLAFLPMNLTIITTSTLAQTRILPRTGPKVIVVFGMAFGIAAMLFFTQLTPHSTYAADVLPGLFLVGLAMGSIFSAAFGTATLGVKPTEAGVASAMVNTSQQVGGSIGTAALSTVFASSAASYLATHLHGHVNAVALRATALVHGYTTAFWWAAGIYVVGLCVALFVLPPRERLPVGAAAGEQLSTQGGASTAPALAAE